MLILAGMVFAEPIGPAFFVGECKTDLGGRGTVAMAPNGNFVITWSSIGADGNGWGVYARRYDASGTALSDKFLVNTFAEGNQWASRIAMDGAGNFVITWASEEQNGSGGGIYAQRYNASGIPLGNEIQVKTHNTNLYRSVSIAMNNKGNFVIVWSSTGKSQSYEWNIFARCYDASGKPKGSEFQVNPRVGNSHSDPLIGIDESGNFVIVWTCYLADNTKSIFLQCYDTSDIPQKNMFQVNSDRKNSPDSPFVGMNSTGKFVIAWMSRDNVWNIYARRYDASGTPLGEEFRVNTTAEYAQTYPSVSMDDLGNYIIAWSEDDWSSRHYSMHAQQYDASGTRRGPEFQVNTHAQYSNPSVAMNNSGNYVIAWMGKMNDTYGVCAQRFSFDTATPETENTPME